MSLVAIAQTRARPCLFFFGVESMVSWDCSYSGKGVASSLPPSRIKDRVFSLRENARVHSKFVPMNMAICRNVGQHKNLAEGSESPSFPFRIGKLTPSIARCSSSLLHNAEEAFVLRFVLDLFGQHLDGIPRGSFHSDCEVLSAFSGFFQRMRQSLNFGPGELCSRFRSLLYVSTHPRWRSPKSPSKPTNPSSRRKSSRDFWKNGVYLDDTQSEDGDCGHFLDFVYDVVMTRQSSYELEGNGWHSDENHEAVCTWCEMEFLERTAF